MPVDDLGDLHKGLYDMQKAIERIQPVTAGGDSTHPGSGANSLQVGVGPVASGDESVALGHVAYATNERSMAIGYNSLAEHDGSTAIGYNSATTEEDQIMLGNSNQVVTVPGRLNLAAIQTGSLPPPSSSSDVSGANGDVMVGNGYIYFKSTGGSWLRVAGSTF